tara:strand:- start:37402 stop:37530 length:129 start_codon:yes stop_codon:yes gene_type:complete
LGRAILLRVVSVPADLAYGENPGEGRPGGMLVLDVELLEIVR